MCTCIPLPPLLAPSNVERACEGCGPVSHHQTERQQQHCAVGKRTGSIPRCSYMRFCAGERQGQGRAPSYEGQRKSQPSATAAADDLGGGDTRRRMGKPPKYRGRTHGFVPGVDFLVRFSFVLPPLPRRLNGIAAVALAAPSSSLFQPDHPHPANGPFLRQSLHTSVCGQLFCARPFFFFFLRGRGRGE